MVKKAPRHVAVALVFDRATGRLLMVSSRAHPDLWICAFFDINCRALQVCVHELICVVPKGGIEEGESSGEAAVRESWEEGMYVSNTCPHSSLHD